jgi:hypothetical protein
MVEVFKSIKGLPTIATLSSITVRLSGAKAASAGRSPNKKGGP